MQEEATQLFSLVQFIPICHCLHSIQHSPLQLVVAPGTDILEVDGGDSVAISWLQHVASQAPVLGVRAELQDLATATITATWK